MNRRQKIIVSVTGIFIVLLLLVGLTYGYFLTKISGNTNSKSISVSTANLALVYGNDDGNVIGENEVIEPNTTFDAKTFTVTNEGNATTDYVVVIENATNNFKYNDFVYTLSCTSDGEPCTGVDTETTYPINGGVLVANTIEVGKTHTYSFTLKYVDTGSDQSEDMNKTLTGKINIKDISTINPYNSDTDSLAYNIINNSVLGTNETTLKAVPDTVPAEEISAYDTPGQYSYEIVSTGSLCASYGSWKVGDTASAAKSGSIATSIESSVGKYVYDSCDYWTRYLESYDASASTLTFKVEQTSEKTLSVTQDDYGTSYYYRGAVEDNYVEFNNMCWRIVRIEGDGSIKITLAAQKKCSEITYNYNDSKTALISSNYYGSTQFYPTNSSGETSSSAKYVADYLNDQYFKGYGMKTKLDAWLTSSGIDTTKLKQDNWCLGNWTDAYDSSGTLLTDSKNDLMYNDTTFYYDTYRRLSGLGTTPYATLKCSDNNYETYSSYIGALTADEVVFAGAKVGANNYTYYLRDNANYNEGWWGHSSAYFNGVYDYAFYVSRTGELKNINVAAGGGNPMIRPVITLASNVKISSGTGTQTDPYVVE